MSVAAKEERETRRTCEEVYSVELDPESYVQ